MSGTDTANGLERSVGLSQLVFYGTGTILGAGIFVVIGEVIGEAGQLAPLAYLLAAIVAVTSALSFAECAARVPTAAGAIDYLERGFERRWLGSLAGWVLLVANIVSAATITTGFVSYVGSFADLPSWAVSTGLLILLGGVAAAGMKESAWLMTSTTVIGLVTLLAILWVLREGLIDAPEAMVETLIGGAAGGDWTLAGLFAGAFLAVYSFIGFGDMAQTAEEVEDVRRTLPRAMTIALLLVFVFYIAVSTALIGSGPTDAIAGADAPLVRAVEREGLPGLPFAIASLFVIVNGVLTQLIAGARLLLDLGRDAGRGAPPIFGRVNGGTATPVIATVTCTAIALVLALFVPLKSLAAATSFAILIVFLGVNLALLAFKRRGQPEGVPDIWRIVPVIGALACAVALGGQILRWTTGIGG